MKPLTTEFVRRYCSHMIDHFDATLFQVKYAEHLLDFIPGYSEFEKVIDALAMIGVTNPLASIQRTSFTLGEFVCVSYEVGVSTTKGGLDYQVRNIAHEITHVLQHRADPLFLGNYLTSRSRRASYWAEAGHPVLEISFHRRGRLPSIALMVENLQKNYYVRKADAKVAKLHLEAYSNPVEQGAVGSEVGKEAIAFMKANGY